MLTLGVKAEDKRSGYQERCIGLRTCETAILAKLRNSATLLHGEHHSPKEGGKMIQDKEGMRKLTKEISVVIERNLRAEIQHERKAMLESELAKARTELSQLGQPRQAAARHPARPAKRAVAHELTAAKPSPSGRRAQSDSARNLIIQTLRHTKHPMTIKELTKTILHKGWKTERKNPTKTVDAALRNNSEDFRRTAPSTFKLVW